MSEREPQPSTDKASLPGGTNPGESDTSAEDFKPFSRKRFWRNHPDSSPAPQETTHPRDETTSEG